MAARIDALTDTAVFTASNVGSALSPTLVAI